MKGCQKPSLHLGPLPAHTHAPFCPNIAVNTPPHAPFAACSPQGLPFRGFAERLGSAVLPSIEAAREAERYAKLAARQAADQAEVVVPEVPHVLPFTRW